MPFVVSIKAVMLIVRGLNLGIPYVSPEFDKDSNKVTCCEKPGDEKMEVKFSPKKCSKK